MQIRKYSPADKEKVMEIFRLNVPAFFAPPEEQDLSEYLDGDPENFYLLEVEGEPAGCGGFNFSDDGATGKISWDFFHPAWQGKGLGSRLLEFRLGRLMADPDIRHITVRTSQMAYVFYEKAGFVLREIVKDYWAPGFDLYRMELEGFKK